MPSIKVHTQTTNAQIGTALFFFGVFSLISLLMSKKDSGKTRISFWLSSLCTVWISLCICAIAFASSPLQLYMCFRRDWSWRRLDRCGCVNMQGILFLNKDIISRLLICFMPCTAAGSLVLSIIAAIAASAALKSGSVFPLCRGAICCDWDLFKTGPSLITKKAEDKEAKPASERKIPFFVIVCGLLTLLAYSSSEGSVAEWGPFILLKKKMLPIALGALVYGVFLQ